MKMGFLRGGANMYCITHSYVWHDVFVCEFTSEVLETRDENGFFEGRCEYVLYHSFIRVTWRIRVWIHIWSVRLSRWKWVFWGKVWICAVWLIHTCDLTHVCVNSWFIPGVLETWGRNAVYDEGECEYVLCNSSICVTLCTHVWIYTRRAANSRW